MKIASKQLKNFDTYGKGVTLNINGKETIKSKCGGLFSLINLTFFIVILLINFYELVFNKSAIISASEIFRPSSDLQKFSEKDIMISNFFFIAKPGVSAKSIPIFPKISEASQLIIKEENQNVVFERKVFGNFSDCLNNEQYMKNLKFNAIKDKIKFLNKENFLACLNFNDSNVTVGGDSLTSKETMRVLIESSYNLCKFVNKSEDCQLESSDFKYLSQVKLMNIIKNNYVDKHEENGYNDMFQTFLHEIDFSKDFFMKIFMRKVNITTDNNFLYNIFPNNETETFLFSFEIITVPRTRSPNNFGVTYEIILDNYTTIIERSYLKLDEMLANVGSIVVIIEFLSKYFADFFSEGNFEHSVYKEVFHIKKKNFADIDPKIFSAINKFKDNENKLKSDNQINNDKHDDMELQDINKKLPNSSFNNSLFLNVKNNNFANIENQDASVIKAFSDRNNNENKHLNDDANKSNLTHFYQNEKQIEQNKNDLEKQDKKAYNEFRKILKEKTIKKSALVKFYQSFIPCFIKKNKNLKLLINLQDYINEELDIVKIVKKLIEYEHFKGLFLTEDQIKIFNLMQKRIITEEILEEDSSDFYINFYFKNKMKELKSFKHIVDHLSNIDEANQYSKPILEKIISSFKF